MLHRALAASAVTAVAALVLTGCVAKADLAEAIPVAIVDDACAVETPTATAGAVTFRLTNDGSDVNEFEVLGDDKLRIVGEKENVAPGQTVDFTAHLEPGTYYTACKFQQVGAPIGLAEFTVTGEATGVSADRQELADRAVDEYLDYVRSQVAELLPAAAAFAAAYASGDDETARSLYAAARVPYERIEPTAEAFGDLDPRIDFREVDAVADGLEWTGFHRIEKDLWPPAAGDLNSDGQDALADWAPSTPAERQALADRLVADVTELHDLVADEHFSVSLDAISNGAIALLDEVAAGKITGEEDWWSGTDLSDFAANVQGAGVAFGAVRPIAEATDEGAELAAEIDARFDELEAALGEYGSLEDGFVDYATLDDAQTKALSDRVNALAEPLSQLTATVLGS
ncbi:imelysin family protein [Agromyces tropicus]|uniref:Imelysin family protein n=1 Tax=Agromyces tropicus TaxID=555371 RepID=A0ABN2U842_9MICO